jgi:hypothetical protein
MEQTEAQEKEGHYNKTTTKQQNNKSITPPT